MSTEHAVARSTLEAARLMFISNVEGITLDEALDTAGGFRSIIGLIKHTAGWTAVYRSFAFDATPRTWMETDWPRRLRERIDPSVDYLRSCSPGSTRCRTTGSTRFARASILMSHGRCTGRAVAASPHRRLRSRPRAYHAGEINLILAVRRNEAWEYGEHVEENHISTIGHSVRGPWFTDEYINQVEAEMRRAAQPNNS
jgi:hypothetical protein